MAIAFETTNCVQDQYGNQYNFKLDTAHQYITGSATNAQGCSGGTWPLLGSYAYTEKGILVEFTLVNPSESSSCVDAYKLKGIWPDSAWYYESGYGAQEFTFVPCGTAVKAEATAAAKKKGQGALKK
jgi:hypothetical protein